MGLLANKLDIPGNAIQSVGKAISGVIFNPFGINNVSVQRPPQDFPEGLILTEIQNGARIINRKIKLLSTWMPVQPFTFGGTLRTSKEFYAGNPEPVIQILGTEEKDWVFSGRFWDRKIKDTDLKAAAQNMALLLEEMRLRGNILEIVLGEHRRFGLLIDTDFNLKTKDDVDYRLTFEIIGFRQPKFCQQVSESGVVPLDASQAMADALALYLDAFQDAPTEVPRSIADTINGIVSDVAGLVGSVTGFVDDILSQVEDVSDAVVRGVGLVKFVRGELIRAKRRIGQIAFNTSTYLGLSVPFRNITADFVIGVSVEIGPILDEMDSFQARLEQLRSTIPLTRHRIAEDDTLQRLAVKFYNDASKWEDIFDHNDLETTDLVVGSVIEIPRI